MRGVPCDDVLVSFQVAVDSAGSSRGFAFVDMSSSEEADRAQAGSNGTAFNGQEMRVAFSMPCRPGACILQHKAPQVHSVSHTPFLLLPLQPIQRWPCIVPVQQIPPPLLLHAPVLAVAHLDPEVMMCPSVTTLAVCTAPPVLIDKTNNQHCSRDDQINDIVGSEPAKTNNITVPHLTLTPPCAFCRFCVEVGN